MHTIITQENVHNKCPINVSTQKRGNHIGLKQETGKESGVPLYLQRSAHSLLTSSPQVQLQDSEGEEGLLEPIESETPIQTKLIIGTPDDNYEREADQVADTVMRVPDSHIPQPFEEEQQLLFQNTNTVQTKSFTPLYIQRICTECEDEMQPNDLTSSTTGIVQGKANGEFALSPMQKVANTNQSPMGGSRLPQHVESRISNVLNTNLTHVRVHDDHAAKTAAQSINAKAFTHQNHIYLGDNQSASDTHLMAHEATHVVQQGAANTSSLHGFHAPRSSGVISKVGNAAVQRKEPFRRVEAETPSVAQINAMTLSDFQEFTMRQLDWATSPHLTVPAAATHLANFRRVLEFSREPNILTTCGDMPVGQIISAGLPGAFTHLRNYSRGAVSSRSTAWLRLTSNVTDAVNWGTALVSLEGVCAAGTLRLIMPAPSPLTTPSVFENLYTKGKTADFVSYVSTCSPVLSATNGAEINSYLALRDEGADPVTYFEKITYVKDFHRFTKPALDGIVANESVPLSSQQSFWSRRPLTVVLYSALDHNGAFHRLPGITQLILAPRILTIVLEGLPSLAAYQLQLGPIAARYGIDGEIDQAMIAGHGSSGDIELAGTVTGDVVHSEKLAHTATPAERTATENLIDELVAHMSTDPTQRRIVLYACLTASHQVSPTGIDPSNPATASAQIRRAISINPNIRDFIASRAGAGATVMGSQASQWATGFLTPGTLFTPPRLTLQTPHDQYIAASKLQYVEFGPESGGATRALAECWAVDFATTPPGTACRDAVTRRIGRPASTDWDAQIIRGIFDIALHRYWSNGHKIVWFSQLADWLSYLKHDKDNPQGRNLWNIVNPLSSADINTVFTALSTTSNWSSEARIRLIFNQTWMRHDASKQADFLSALSTYTNCGDVVRYVDISIVRPRISNILPATPLASPPVHELIIAIMEAIANPITTPEPVIVPRHIQYLRTLLGSTTNFPTGLNISGVASGLTTEDSILTAIGRSVRRPVPPGSSPPPMGTALPNANVDLNGDGFNDFYLEPFQRRGTVDNCWYLHVRSRPWMSRIIDVIPQGRMVHIVGRYHNWYGIEHGGRIRFVYKDFMTVAS